MFLHAKDRVTRLEALKEELMDRILEARHRRQFEEANALAERRRQVMRAILLSREFSVPGIDETFVTIDEMITRYR